MVLKNKLNKLKEIKKKREASNSSSKDNPKRKIKGIASIALVMAELAMPAARPALAYSPIYPAALELYQTMDRLERYGDSDMLQQFLETHKTYEERNFVNLLEDGTIFVLNTKRINGEPRLIISGIDEAIMPGTETEITEKNDGVTRIVYGKEKNCV